MYVNKKILQFCNFELKNKQEAFKDLVREVCIDVSSFFNNLYVFIIFYEHSSINPPHDNGADLICSLMNENRNGINCSKQKN